MEKSSFRFKLFFFTVVLSFLVHLLLMNFLPGSHQIYIFFEETKDYMADFFNVLRWSANKDVYMNPDGFGFTCYLPLNYVLLYPFHVFADFQNMSLQQCWASPAANLCADIYTVISVCLLLHSIVVLLKKYEITSWGLIPVLIGNITLFSLERGNWIIITAAFIYYFFAYYDSENEKLRFFAASALVFASVLKIYPVFFGLLYLQKKDWKMIVFCFIYGILLTLIPFLFCKSGFHSIPRFLETLKWNSVTYEHAPNPKFGFSYMFYLGGRYLVNHKGFSDALPDFLFNFSKWFIRIVCVYSIIISFFTKDNFHKIFLICLSILYFPAHSEYYCGLYLYPLMVIFFATEKERKNWENNIVLLFFIILFQDIQITYGSKYNITRLLVNCCTLLIYCILVIKVSVTVFFNKKRLENNI